MDQYEQEERKRLARHRLHAQKARAGRLRNRAITISLACFALLWGTVFVQMATGNDPVLGRSAASAAAAAQESATPDGERQRRRLGRTSAAIKTAVGGSPPEAEAPEAVEPQGAEEELEPVTTSQS